MPLILASASPRRAALLQATGIAFTVRPADVDESAHPDEGPVQYALRVARAKARALGPEDPNAHILAADTVVVVDGEVLGKPRDPAEARNMLTRLSGRAHEVVTAVVLVPPAARGHAAAVEAVERTVVEFRPLTADEIAAYVAQGEPMDKAGAYAVQGGASEFVTRLVGSYSNVVGLPVPLVFDLLRQTGGCPGGARPPEAKSQEKGVPQV